MRALLLLPLACLAACQTKPIETMNYTERKALVAGYIDACRKQGISLESPEMQTCVKVEIDRDFATRERNRRVGAAIGAALSETGDNMRQDANARMIASQANRPINCRSQYLGQGASQTTCRPGY